MNLLFICASLEPARDGVGDYVRLLAGACQHSGHSCRLLALSDQFVSTARTENQAGLNGPIEAWRFPAQQSWAERFSAAQQCVHDFSPDWLSWHLVPYGFNPKGILPSQLSMFAMLGRGRSAHVMMHELWIGISAGEPIKNRIYGWFQRKAVVNFLHKLRPAVLHTSNFVYREVLDRAGYVASILPLFGNIPVVELSRTPPSDREWVGGIFGTVHPQLQLTPCFDRLAEGARVSGRQLRILGIGRLGKYGDELFARLAVDYAKRITVSQVGEKTPEEISWILQTLDFGIATHPWALLGKSGAVAAMLDHGLPVVVPRDDWELRKNPRPVPAIDPSVIALSKMPPELMAGYLARKHAPAPRLPAVAAHFLECLAAAHTPSFSDL